MSAVAFFSDQRLGKRPTSWVENQGAGHGFRSPRNCLAQFLPTNEFHSREIRQVGD
jgi:hypothetical protein